MLMAAIAYGVMCVGSLAIVGTSAAVSPNWLIGTYLLTYFRRASSLSDGYIAGKQSSTSQTERLDDGRMVCSDGKSATISCLYLCFFGVKISTAALWGILIIICLISAAFIFSIMKKLEAATSDAPAADTDSLETVGE